MKKAVFISIAVWYVSVVGANFFLLWKATLAAVWGLDSRDCSGS